MEHSIVGPAVLGIIAVIATISAAYSFAVREGILPQKSFFDGFWTWALMILFGAVIGVLSGAASDELFFNADYYAQQGEEKEERFESLKGNGYEHWALIDSRPIEKSKIASCEGDVLVTNDDYRKVDVGSQELKTTRGNLHVFCKTN